MRLHVSERREGKRKTQKTQKTQKNTKNTMLEGRVSAVVWQLTGGTSFLFASMCSSLANVAVVARGALDALDALGKRTAESSQLTRRYMNRPTTAQAVSLGVAGGDG